MLIFRFTFVLSHVFMNQVFELVSMESIYSSSQQTFVGETSLKFRDVATISKLILCVKGLAKCYIFTNLRVLTRKSSRLHGTTHNVVCVWVCVCPCVCACITDLKPLHQARSILYVVGIDMYTEKWGHIQYIC